nr:hypothetical protein [Bordetella bronchiseptica]
MLEHRAGRSYQVGSGNRAVVSTSSSRRSNP